MDVCVELGRFGLDGEIDRLRRDKQVLTMELVKLRQQQQNTKENLQVMEERLRRTEIRQQQMMGFLARAMKNPNFVQQLMMHKDMRLDFEEAITNKRRRQIDQGLGNDVEIPFVKIEPEEHGGDACEFEVSELDRLAMDMQREKNIEERGDCYVELNGSQEKQQPIDHVFWEKFLSEDMDEEEMRMLAAAGVAHGIDEIEDIDSMVKQLGLLSSISPK